MESHVTSSATEKDHWFNASLDLDLDQFELNVGDLADSADLLLSADELCEESRRITYSLSRLCADQGIRMRDLFSRAADTLRSLAYDNLLEPIESYARRIETRVSA